MELATASSITPLKLVATLSTEQVRHLVREELERIACLKAV